MIAVRFADEMLVRIEMVERMRTGDWSQAQPLWKEV